MSLEWVYTLIGNVGFPIAAFLLMYKLVTNHLEKIACTLEKLEKAINENTKTLNELRILIEERLRR